MITTAAPRSLSKRSYLSDRVALGFLPSLSLPRRRLPPQTSASRRICGMSAEDPSKVNFGDVASNYDELVVKPLAGPFFQVLKRLAPPSVGDSCLDLATGTGPVAFRIAALIGEGGKVLGVDYSQEMLDLAKNNAESPENKAVSDRISWMQADACNMSLPSASFDRAYCREGLQFMPDPKVACELTRKALKPGGTFIASCKAPADATSNPMFAAFHSAMVSVGKHDWANMLQMPTCWAETDSAGVERFHSCMKGGGFEDVNVVVEDVQCNLPSIERVFVIVTALPFGDELVGDAALFDAFKSSVLKALDPYISAETGAVSLPVRALFARAVVPQA